MRKSKYSIAARNLKGDFFGFLSKGTKSVSETILRNNNPTIVTAQKIESEVREIRKYLSQIKNCVGKDDPYADYDYEQLSNWLIRATRAIKSLRKGGSGDPFILRDLHVILTP